MWSSSHVPPVPVSCVPQYGHVAAPAVVGAPHDGQCVAPPVPALFGVVVPGGRTKVTKSENVSELALPSVATPLSTSCVNRTPDVEKRTMTAWRVPSTVTLMIAEAITVMSCTTRFNPAALQSAACLRYASTKDGVAIAAI